MALSRLSNFLNFVSYGVLALSHRTEERNTIHRSIIFELHDVLLSIRQHISITSRKVLIC
jgi:hypothetical protein